MPRENEQETRPLRASRPPVDEQPPWLDSADEEETSEPAQLSTPAPTGRRRGAWIVLLVSGLLGLGAGAGAAVWLRGEVPTQRVVEASRGAVTHHGWNIRMMDRQLQRGDRGTLLLLRLEVTPERGSAEDAGRHFLLDVDEVSRVPAFWSTSGVDLTIAFTMHGKQKRRLGLRFVPPGLRFWPPGTPALLMKLN